MTKIASQADLWLTNRSAHFLLKAAHRQLVRAVLLACLTGCKKAPPTDPGLTAVAEGMLGREVVVSRIAVTSYPGGTDSSILVTATLANRGSSVRSILVGLSFPMFLRLYASDDTTRAPVFSSILGKSENRGARGIVLRGGESDTLRLAVAASELNTAGVDVGPYRAIVTFSTTPRYSVDAGMVSRSPLR